MKRFRLILIPLVILLIGFAFFRSAKKSQLTRVEKDSQAFLPYSPAIDESVRETGYGNDATKMEMEDPSVKPVRKIIHSGEITIVVKHYEPFFQHLQKQIAFLGGYIANIDSRRGGESVSSASLILKVPPERLQTAVSWLREQGILTSEKIRAEDISEQYYDLKARLENAKRFEMRLLEMLRSQTGSLQDLIQVEEKLNQIREQIEQMEGRLRYFEALSNLATLTVQVQVQAVYVPPSAPTYGQRMARTWFESIRALKRVAQDVTLFLVAIAPWVLPVLIAGVLIRYLLVFALNVLRRSRALVYSKVR